MNAAQQVPDDQLGDEEILRRIAHFKARAVEAFRSAETRARSILDEQGLDAREVTFQGSWDESLLIVDDSFDWIGQDGTSQTLSADEVDDPGQWEALAEALENLASAMLPTEGSLRLADITGYDDDIALELFAEVDTRGAFINEDTPALRRYRAFRAAD